MTACGEGGGVERAGVTEQRLQDGDGGGGEGEG